ncbi:MAG: hypothetical protein RLZZ397_1362 [Pseudomonadota bacterium]
MKKLTLIALVLASGAAFANGPGNGNGNGNGGGQEQVSDPTTQATMLLNTAVVNTAFGPGSTAQQNLASNVGSFEPDGTELQMVMAKNAFIMNSAMGGEAEQNIASNVGHEGLQGATVQMALIKDSAVINRAGWGGQALQNLSSNSNCITCE